MEKVVLLQCPQKFEEVIDLWTKFAERLNFFDKFYLITDSKRQFKSKLLEVIRTDKDMQFASNLRFLIKRMPVPDTFFLFIEDHIICNSESKLEDTKNALERAFQFINSNKDCGFLRIVEKSNCVYLPYKEGEEFAEISFMNKFYVDYQPAIWKKEYLLRHLKDGEDAWVSEKEANSRIKRYIAKAGNLRAFASTYSIVNIMNCFRTGCFYREEFVRFALDNNMELENDFPVHVFVPNLKSEQISLLGLKKSKFKVSEKKRRTQVPLKDYIEHVYKYNKDRGIEF